MVPECQELQNALLQVCFGLYSVRSSVLSRRGRQHHGQFCFEFRQSGYKDT